MLISLMVGAVFGALAAVAWQVGWLGGGNGPVSVAQVPPKLPAGGVELEGGAVVLKPWRTSPTRAISAEQAIAAVRHFAAVGDPYSTPGLLGDLRTHLPVTALKAVITLPHGWPPGSTAISDAPTIGPVRVWLVTFTSPKPIDVGALVPLYVSQFSEAVNPVTGDLVLGFETPVSSA